MSVESSGSDRPSIQPDDGSSHDSTGGDVLVPLLEGEISQRALSVAKGVASEDGAQLLILNVICPPRQTPLTLPEHRLEEHRDTTANVLKTVVKTDTEIAAQGVIRIGRRPASVVTNAIDAYDIETVVIGRPWCSASSNPITRSPAEKLLTRGDCDVVITIGAVFPEKVSSILVPVAGGPHSGLAIDIAHALAATHDAWIDILYVIVGDELNQRHEAERYVSKGRARLGGFDDTDTWIPEAEDVADAIVEQSRYYDVTIVGTPQAGLLRRLVFGSTSMMVQEGAPNTALVTHWQSDSVPGAQRWFVR